MGVWAETTAVSLTAPSTGESLFEVGQKGERGPLSVLTLPSWARGGNGACVGRRKRVLECTMVSGNGSRGHMISRASHGAPGNYPTPPTPAGSCLCPLPPEIASAAHDSRGNKVGTVHAVCTSMRHSKHRRRSYNLAGPGAVLEPEVCADWTARDVRFSYHHHIEYSFSASPTFSDNSLNSVCTRYVR